MSSLFRVLVDMREPFDREGHIPFFSGGEGLARLALYATARGLTYRQVNSAIIDHYRKHN